MSQNPPLIQGRRSKIWSGGAKVVISVISALIGKKIYSFAEKWGGGAWPPRPPPAPPSLLIFECVLDGNSNPTYRRVSRVFCHYTMSRREKMMFSIHICQSKQTLITVVIENSIYHYNREILDLRLLYTIKYIGPYILNVNSVKSYTNKN